MPQKLRGLPPSVYPQLLKASLEPSITRTRSERDGRGNEQPSPRIERDVVGNWQLSDDGHKSNKERKVRSLALPSLSYKEPGNYSAFSFRPLRSPKNLQSRTPQEEWGVRGRAELFLLSGFRV